MSDQPQDFAEQGAAFQKIWLESISRLMQVAFTASPNSTPPEFIREVRDGTLKALGESWNEFLRSPQFQQSMKQWMDNAIAFRQMSNDFMSRVRQELQAPSCEDIEAIQLNMRHLEARLLDRLETLSKQIEELKQSIGASGASAEPPAKPKARPRTRERRPGKTP